MQTEQLTAVPTTEPAEVITAAVDAPETEQDVVSTAALTVKFNKQEYQLSQEDAVNYAQMGMKFQSVQPVFDKLKLLATEHGQSVTEYVDALCGAPVELNERLAQEFCALQRECPDLEQFDDLPETVVQQAVDGTPLTLAYLRYCYGEHRRILSAHQTAAAAAAASAGSQRGVAGDLPDPAVEAMLRGVWR